MDLCMATAGCSHMFTVDKWHPHGKSKKGTHVQAGVLRNHPGCIHGLRFQRRCADLTVRTLAMQSPSFQHLLLETSANLPVHCCPL